MIDAVCVQGKKVDKDLAKRLALQFGVELIEELPKDKFCKYLLVDKNGVAFVAGKQELRADFTGMLSRVTGGHLQHEILLKAVKLNGREPRDGVRVVDATAGLGEDSFILAAAGYQVEMFEHNEVTAILLADALRRGKKDPKLKEIVSRMTLKQGDSKTLMSQLSYEPDVIYLDPMFPEKKKSAETKKKFQVLHQIENPCDDEKELMEAALLAKPQKIVVKRPPEGPFLADIKPSHSVTRKAVRFDCIVCK